MEPLKTASKWRFRPVLGGSTVMIFVISELKDTLFRVSKPSSEGRPSYNIRRWWAPTTCTRLWTRFSEANSHSTKPKKLSKKRCYRRVFWVKNGSFSWIRDISPYHPPTHSPPWGCKRFQASSIWNHAETSTFSYKFYKYQWKWSMTKV